MQACAMQLMRSITILLVGMLHDGDTFSEIRSSTLRRAVTVMNIEWDYNYYQPWSDNEWLVGEMLAMLDKDITMQ